MNHPPPFFYVRWTTTFAGRDELYQCDILCANLGWGHRNDPTLVTIRSKSLAELEEELEEVCADLKLPVAKTPGEYVELSARNEGEV